MSTVRIIILVLLPHKNVVNLKDETKTTHCATPGWTEVSTGVMWSSAWQPYSGFLGSGGATPTTEGDLLKDSFSPSSAHSCCGAQGMLIIRPQPTRRASDESKLRV